MAKTTPTRRPYGLRALILAVSTGIVLTACSGGGDSGQEGPDPVVAAQLSGSVTGTINQSQAGNVVVEVTLDDATEPGTVVTATLTDSLGATASASATVGAEAINLMIGPISITGLSDGVLDLSLSAEFPNGQSSTSGVTAMFMLDTTAPTAPSSIGIVFDGIPTWPTPADTINLTNQGAASVSVEFAADSSSSDQATITLSDALGGSVTSGNFAAPAGGGNVTIVLDASSLAEGAVSAVVAIQDTVGNSSSLSNSGVVKDTFVAGPEAALVPAGANNPQGYVNATTRSGVSVAVTMPAESIDTDQIRVDLSNGATTISSSFAAAPAGGGLFQADGLDVSSLADGNLSLSVVVVDDRGNAVTFQGSGPELDSVIGATFDASVLSSANNATGMVNGASVGSAMVNVVTDQFVGAGDQVTVTMTVGGSTAQFQQTATAGPGSVSFGPIDLSALDDGTGSFTVAFSDIAGNQSSGAAGAFDKDTLAPTAPSNLAVAAGVTNAANSINASNVSAVLLDVTFDASMTGTEIVVVTLSDGSQSVPSGPFSPPTGGGPTTIGPFDANALQNGSISLTMQLTDTAGNSTSFNGTTAAKTTSGPPAPASAFVAAGSNNGQGEVNRHNVGAATVTVNFGSGSSSNHQATVHVSDGSSTVTTAPMTAPNGSGALNFTGLDFSSLSDGVLTVSVDVDDTVSLTSIVFSGSSAAKDTALGVPSSGVLAGASNLANVVNLASANAATVRVAFPASSLSNDAVFVTVSDGSSSVATSTMNASNGSGNVDFVMDLSTLAEGNLSVTATVTNGLTSQVVATPGTSALKDTIPAAAAISAQVANIGVPANTINLSSAGSVDVSVTLPGSYDGSETVTVTLSDGATSATSGSVTAPIGGGSLMFAGIDASGLAETAISITVDTIDGAGNPGMSNGTSATKDTIAPIAPSSLGIAAGPSNSADVINLNNIASALLDVNWDASMDGTESVTLMVTSSGGGSAQAGPFAPPLGGGVNVIGPFDLSGIGNGTGTLAMTLTDVAGNPTPFTGTAATINLAGPPLPSSASVSIGAFNPADYINLASATAVEVQATWTTPANPGETATVTLSDGVGSVTSTPQSSPTTPGTLTFAGLDASSLVDGPITVRVDVTDGSLSPFFNGTSAIKDTIAPDAPTAAMVNGGASNPANVINSFTVTGPELGITFPGTYAGTEVYNVSLSDGVASISTADIPLTMFGTTITAIGPDATSLGETVIFVGVTVIDAAGNSVAYAGTSATKDTVGPVAASSFEIAAGPSNLVSTINQSNQAAFSMNVTWDGSMAGSETASIEVVSSGGGTPITAAPVVPLGGGMTVEGPFDASALADGNLTLTLTITDGNGNPTSFVGSAAVKDVTGPAAPASATVDGGPMNPAGFINTNSVAAVSVTVTMGPTSSNETVEVSLSDGGTTVVMGSTPSTGPSAVLAFGPTDASTLSDGPIQISVKLTDSLGNETITAGTVATLDTVAPDAPISAGVAATANNPANFINIATDLSVSIEVNLAVTYDGTEQVTATLRDSVLTEVSSLTTSAPNGGGVMGLSGINASSLLEEAGLVVELAISDAAGNSITYVGVPAERDVTAPDPATGVSVAAGPSNSANVVDSDNESAVSFDLTAPLSAAGLNAELTITSDQGGGPVMFASTGISSGASVIGTSDLSALNDGNLTLDVIIVDLAGNPSVSMMGTSASMDTSAPSDPVAAFVQQGANNSQDVINGASFTTTMIEVQLPSSSVTTDVVDVRLTDGVATISDNQTPGVSGATTMVFTFDTTTLADGPISIEVVLDDGLGNRSDPAFAGTQATKDIVSPANPTSAGVIAGPSNGANAINASNLASVVIDVVVPGTAEATDQVTVTLSDGVTTLASAPQSSVGGGGTVQFLMDATTLANGSVAVTVDLVDAVGNASLTFNGTNATRFIATESSRYGYAVNATDGSVSIYRVEADGRFSTAGFQTTGATPTDVVIHQSGGFLYTADSFVGNVSAFRIVGPTLSSLGTTPAGITPTGVTIDGTSSYLYALDSGGSVVFDFAINPLTGALTAGTTIVTSVSPSAILANPVTPAVYVASEASDTLEWFSIGGGGTLTSMGSTGIAYIPGQMAIAPNGRHLFGLSNILNTVVTHDLDPVTGAVTVVASSMVPIPSPRGMAISPDGRFAYVVDNGTNLLHQFTVDAVTGVLTAMSPATVATGTAPTAVRVSFDGSALYVANQGDDTVSTFAVAGSGLATLVATVPAMDGPQALDTWAGPISGAGYTLNGLFAVHEGSGDLTTFQIDDATGGLTAVGSATTLDSGASDLTITTDQGFLFAANTTGNGGTGSVSAFTLDTVTLALTPVAGSPFALVPGTNPTAITADISGRFFGIVDPGTDQVSTWSITAGVGTPVNVTTTGLTALGSGSGLAFHPSGKWFYVAEPTATSVFQGNFAIATGASSAGASFVPANAGESIVVHQNGQWAFLTSVGGDTVSTLALLGTGQIASETSLAVGMDPRRMVVHPNGLFGYVVHSGSADIWVVSIDPVTGALAQVGLAVAAGADPRDLAISPRGDHLYVADNNGGLAGQILVFDVDSQTGTLSSNITTPSISSGGTGTVAIRLIANFQ